MKKKPSNPLKTPHVMFLQPRLGELKALTINN